MIRDLIQNNKLVTVEADARIPEVARKMMDQNVGAVLVVDEEDGKPRGIITDRDIVLRCIAKNIDVNDCTVEQVLSETVETVSDTAGVFDCIHKMREAGVRRMPVTDEHGRTVGMVSFGDLLGMLSTEFSELAESLTPPTTRDSHQSHEHVPNAIDQLKAA
jgi:signal-transduction protein with cAMP-binding, CBS, and nucleotidyltransferase domain